MPEHESETFHRQKARLPLWVFALATGLPGLVLGGGGAYLISTELLPFVPSLAIASTGVNVALLVGAILLTTGIVRVAVSERELHAQIGTHHLRVPIDEITSVEVAPSPTRSVGVSVRATVGGDVVYSMLGRSKRAVHLRRRSEKGAIILVCREPDALADAVEAARARTQPELLVADEPAEPPVGEDVGRPPGSDTRTTA